MRLWDMLGGDGVPVRIAISDMGPDLLGPAGEPAPPGWPAPPASSRRAGDK